jgi:hypothetical protein
MMRNKYLKNALIFFFFFLVFHTIWLRLFGFPARYTLVKSEPYTWREIYYALPNMILLVSIMTILLVLFLIEGDKVKEKQKEETRKRIAEKNRKKLERRKRTKEVALKMNLLKLDTHLLNISAYKCDSHGGI